MTSHQNRSRMAQWSRYTCLVASAAALTALNTTHLSAGSSALSTSLISSASATIGTYVPTPPPGPPNDDVCNATHLNIIFDGQNTVQPTLFNNTNATVQASEPSPGAGTASNSCASQDGWCNFETALQNTIWFKFVAPVCGCVSIRVNTQNVLDHQLALWSVGNCNDFSTFTEIAANDDQNVSFDPLIKTVCGLTPGTTYYIQLDGFAGSQGAGRIGVQSGPVNDCCDAAIQVWDQSVVSGSTRRAETDSVPDCDDRTEPNGHGVWYKLYGDGNRYEASTCNPNTSSYDTEIVVYTGSCGSWTCVTADDDFDGLGPNCPHNSNASKVAFCTQPGVWYFILVDGSTDQRGDFEMSIQQIPSSGYDCDCNGIADECDIEFDPSLDQDNSGFLDSCEDCPDPNCDGFVWWPDAWFVIANYGTTGPHPADVNFDGVVDFHDYLKVIFHLGQFCGFTSGGWWWWWL